MAEKKRNLGRGLAALLGEEKPTADGPVDGLQRVPVHLLHPGKYQPRRRMADDEIGELADSIREKGVLSPLLVRDHPTKAGEFEIIAGERRWRAAQRAQVHDVPVLHRPLTDQEALELGLVENLQREDLSAIEEALGYQRLMNEFSHTQENLAKAVGKSRSHVANMLRLLNLPEPIRTMVEEGKLSAGHARALLTSDAVLPLAERVIAEGLSVRETERLAATKVPSAVQNGPENPSSAKDMDTKNLEQDLASVLGLKVSIAAKGKTGSVTIHYKSLDQLDGLLARLSA